MQVFDDLRELEEFFVRQKKKGRSMATLYESVQQATGVIERLYLMVTAAGAAVDANNGISSDTLADLSEMAKAIQHPLRGLFLRYYMLKKLKDKLPDKTNTQARYLSHPWIVLRIA
jgi:vacuolar protein sorting-associated protein 35